MLFINVVFAAKGHWEVWAATLAVYRRPGNRRPLCQAWICISTGTLVPSLLWHCLQAILEKFLVGLTCLRNSSGKEFPQQHKFFGNERVKAVWHSNTSHLTVSLSLNQSYKSESQLQWTPSDLPSSVMSDARLVTTAIYFQVLRLHATREWMWSSSKPQIKIMMHA